MRGTGDEGANGVVLDVEDLPPRPFGGKPMLRLLELLESQALTSVQEKLIRDATSTEAESAAVDRARDLGFLGAAPDAIDYGTTHDYAATPSSAAPESVASTYAAVATDLAGPPTAVGPQWRSIGPWTVTNGQTYGSSRVNVSGRISALAVDPSSPAHVLAGAANGGVWESGDRGASWRPCTDYQATLTVGALAFDPSTPSIAYCGTGEGDWWSFLGNGVLRSTNGGSSWTAVCTTPFVGQGFYSLIVDPTTGQGLYAGTTEGLYVSADSGTTWTQRRSSQTWTVATGGGQLLAACRDGVFQSTDSGTTWTTVALAGAPASFDRLAVAIAPSNTAVAYAWGAGPPYIPQPGGGQIPTAYLWRRAGGNWTAIGTPPGVATGQAWYDWYVAVAPDRDTQVYCGAIELHRGDLAVGGWTWRVLTNKGTTGDSIHPDQHTIGFEPGTPDTVYAGNDGGLFRSPDRGITWRSCNNGLVVSEFEYLAHDWGSARWLIGGTQDNGTNRWTGSSTWEHVEDADGGDVVVNRQTPGTVVLSRQWGGLRRSLSRGSFNTWSWINPARPAGEGVGLFYPPIEGSATTGDTIAIGMQALYVSRDSGGGWTRLGFPGGGVASAMYIPDPDTVVVGLTNGGVLRTTFSTAWSPLAAIATPRPSAAVSDLYAEPGATGRLIATSRAAGGGRVFVSDDGGTNWTDRTAGLPPLPVNAVAVDTRNHNRIWVAADLGVYESRDAGTTWSTFSNSLPNAFIGDLIYHPHSRVLRAGTRNRGVWEIPVDGWMTQPVCGTQWTGTLQANETRRWFTFRWPATWHVLWTVMPTTVALGAPQITWQTQVERADAEFATYWITVRNLTSSPVSFEGRYAILSRY
ncbi:hypothetical protein ACQPYH_28240 [Kribbella sp. CA-245084]|uniref:hypothetical protein n=1 Tax=Kribbella sp. CA-245084 TaxID=3239940 RepID=UPI003D94D71C